MEKIQKRATKLVIKLKK